MLALYGHPLSSYTWKALIALYAHDIPFEFRTVDPQNPGENDKIVSRAGPLGKFPVLDDGGNLIFEATSIIEHLALHADARGLIPAEPDAANRMRMIDRVFDNYVMNVMQIVVNEQIRDGDNPDTVRQQEAREQLKRVYRWLDEWLADYPQDGRVTLIECAAGPSLYYAHWSQEIDDKYPRLKAWRRHLLHLPAIKRCIDDAAPYRHWFPLYRAELDTV
jgi:glutathione S-transferase